MVACRAPGDRKGWNGIDASVSVQLAKIKAVIGRFAGKRAENL